LLIDPVAIPTTIASRERIESRRWRENDMAENPHRQCVLDFLDAFYADDIERAMSCCDDELDTVTQAPVELFPNLGQKHGKAWVGEAIRTQQNRYSSRKCEVKLILAEGDHVVTIQVLNLRKRSDDRVVRLETAEFFTMRNGRIHIHRSFFDTFNFVEQVVGRDLSDMFAADVRGTLRA
jgi:ketosteroid isomerase-like protein